MSIALNAVDQPPAPFQHTQLSHPSGIMPYPSPHNLIVASWVYRAGPLTRILACGEVRMFYKCDHIC